MCACVIGMHCSIASNRSCIRAVALYCISAVAPSVVIAAMAAIVEVQHLVKGGNLLPAFPWVVKDVETVEGIPFLGVRR